MHYYCNICRQPITKAEFLYSVDKFDRALCRRHQAIERERRAEYNVPSHSSSIVTSNNKAEQPQNSTLKSKKSLSRRVANTMGRGVVLGVKK
jgi:hypothetical protein